jgi:hypothetical protein
MATPSLNAMLAETFGWPSDDQIAVKGLQPEKRAKGAGDEGGWSLGRASSGGSVCGPMVIGAGELKFLCTDFDIMNQDANGSAAGDEEGESVCRRRLGRRLKRELFHRLRQRLGLACAGVHWEMRRKLEPIDRLRKIMRRSGRPRFTPECHRECLGRGFVRRCAREAGRHRRENRREHKKGGARRGGGGNWHHRERAGDW